MNRFIRFFFRYIAVFTDGILFVEIYDGKEGSGEFGNFWGDFY